MENITEKQFKKYEKVRNYQKNIQTARKLKNVKYR